jgi:hypothetical protein
MTQELALKQLLGTLDTPTPSANRSQQQQNQNERTTVPPPRNDPPPRANRQIVPPPPPRYPPAKGILWQCVYDIIDKAKQCPVCHNCSKFHWEIGCPALAKKGFAISKDQAKSKEVITKYEAVEAMYAQQWEQRDRASRGGAGRGDASSSSRGGRGNQNGYVAAGRRATSSKRVTLPPAQPGLPPANQFSQFTDNHEIYSNSNDDAPFLQDYGNNVDAAGQSVSALSNSSKTKTSSTNYTSSFRHYNLPFGGLMFNKQTSRYHCAKPKHPLAKANQICQSFP